MAKDAKLKQFLGAVSMALWLVWLSQRSKWQGSMRTRMFSQETIR